MKTIYSNLFDDEVVVRTDNKKDLQKALKVVFGDNADCYFELAINDGNGVYELSLANKYALAVFENL